MTNAMTRVVPIFAAAAIVTAVAAAAALAQDSRRGDLRDHPHWTAPARAAPFRAPPPTERGPSYPGAAWDPGRHNGFWRAGRWYYGPPPREFGVGEVRLGHSPWRRGGYLPSYYHGAVIEDYARYRLRRPPYGYRWVYAGGDYMLVAQSSGMIFDVVPGR